MVQAQFNKGCELMINQNKNKCILLHSIHIQYIMLHVSLKPTKLLFYSAPSLISVYLLGLTNLRRVQLLNFRTLHSPLDGALVTLIILVHLCVTNLPRFLEQQYHKEFCKVNIYHFEGLIIKLLRAITLRNNEIWLRIKKGLMPKLIKCYMSYKWNRVTFTVQR